MFWLANATGIFEFVVKGRWSWESIAGSGNPLYIAEFHIYTNIDPSHQPILAYYHRQPMTTLFCLRGWAQPDATAARGDGGRHCEGRWIHGAISWHLKFENKELGWNMLDKGKYVTFFFPGLGASERWSWTPQGSTKLLISGAHLSCITSNLLLSKRIPLGCKSIRYQEDGDDILQPSSPSRWDACVIMSFGVEHFVYAMHAIC